jgi:hypothetical protein
MRNVPPKRQFLQDPHGTLHRHCLQYLKSHICRPVTDLVMLELTEPETSRTYLVFGFDVALCSDQHFHDVRVATRGGPMYRRAPILKQKQCHLMQLDISSDSSISSTAISSSQDRPCGLVVRVTGYRSRGPRFDSRALKKSSGSGTGSTQPREYN